MTNIFPRQKKEKKHKIYPPLFSSDFSPKFLRSHWFTQFTPLIYDLHFSKKWRILVLIMRNIIFFYVLFGTIVVIWNDSQIHNIMEFLFGVGGGQLVRVVLLLGKGRRTRVSQVLYDEKYAVQGVKASPVPLKLLQSRDWNSSRRVR